MRIATWNVNGIRARTEYLKLWLADRKPDIIGLQELKITDELFPVTLFEDLGYHAVCHGQKAWNGVALLSREPIETELVGLPGQEDLGARLIAGRVGDVLVITVYCPNGKALDHADYERKLTWFDSLAALLSAHYCDEERLVLCGDFNVCATPLDSWSGDHSAGHIFHTAQERKRLQSLVSTGLTDAYRHLYPTVPGYTWWDYRGGSLHRKRGLRIDSVFVSQAILHEVKDVVADRDWRKKKDGLTASDHCPLWIDI